MHSGFTNPLLVGFVLLNLQGASGNVSFELWMYSFWKIHQKWINPKSVVLHQSRPSLLLLGRRVVGISWIEGDFLLFCNVCADKQAPSYKWVTFPLILQGMWQYDPELLQLRILWYVNIMNIYGKCCTCWKTQKMIPGNA